MNDGLDRDRRRLLLAFAGAPLLTSALAACDGDPAPKSAPGLRPDVDVKVRWRATGGEHTLLAMYSAAVATHPALTQRLAPIQQHHEEHLAALEASGPLPFGAADPAAAWTVPGTAEAALKALRDTERTQSAARVADCLAATGPRLAAVLASVAACEAGHEAALAAI